MYDGTEKLISDGKYLDVTMLDFWRWGYSNLLHNMQRGTLAEFIVKSALDSIPICKESNRTIGTSIDPFDVNGPTIKALGRQARIEVKSAAKVQLWDIRHPDRLSFSIAAHRAPDENGEYFDDTVPTRNNDIYVFAVYTATDRRSNILDLSWWEFYVAPTYRIDQLYGDQKTVILSRIQESFQPCRYADLLQSIVDICDNYETKDRP